MALRSLQTGARFPFLAGGGEMGARMRELDWSHTALGPVDTWPQSLRSTLSMLLPSKAQIILFWGPEFVVLYNDAYRPVFGAKHPDALGVPGREAWSEIWDSMLHDLLAGVVRTGEAFWAKDLLFTIERYGFEEETYFDVSYDPVRVESGHVGGVFCIVTETTERVVGERRMALLNALAAHNATARTSRDACVLTSETLASRPDDITFALTYLDDELQSCTPGAEEALAAAPRELVKEVPIRLSGSPARTGKLIVGLSERRPFDDKYRAFLDLVAGQLATALVNARAYEEERRRAEALAEIDRAKTAFFSNVSHEFRTPLTLLLGPVQDALVSPGRSLDTDALGAVNRNALRLLKLVNTLLDFARIEAGRMDAAYEPTDLATFTTDLTGAFRSAIESAGLQFDVNCSPLDVPVFVDRSMWEKIVFNLLSNALKFTFEGRIHLTLGREGDSVTLSVSDTGTGIAPDQLPHVFERFHRLRGARARTHEGTGIGLTLVQELVRLHGGSIGVKSRVGEGTTFTVTVPLGKGHVSEFGSEPRSPSSTSITADAYVSEALGWVDPSATGTFHARPADGRSGRILLADDNADMRAYVTRLLGQRWQVDAVADGAAALAAAKEEPPDVVVADVMMPEMDGFELLAALREDPSTRNVPVILLSARAGEEATLKGLAAGADDYLVKPFTANDLLARVDAQWNRAQARLAVRGRMAQIESLLDNAPLGVYLVDQDFRIAHINPVAQAAFGDIPEPVGRDFDDVIHLLWKKDYADEIVRLFRHTLETGESSITPERAEYRIDRGAIEYYEWRVVRIQFPDGRFGVVCYFQDISWLVRARNAITESEERFRAFVTATVDVVFRMNADWSEMHHLDGRNFIADTLEPSRTWIDKYIQPDDQPGIRAAIRKATDTKTMFELEHRIIRVDGTLGWALSRAVPILDAAGNIVEWFGTARDVTARRRSEEMLARIISSSEQQRRLYETILSNTLDLVYVFDRNHRFTYANDALLAMWGKTWEEAIGRNCLELGYEPWHAAMHDREIDQVIATKQPIRGEVPFTGTAGRRTYDYIFFPVFGIDGDVEAVAGSTRDITDRKRSENALRQSQHELTEANRVKDEFLAMLGHELRNPLAPISTAVQLIRMRGGQSREIAVIDRQVGHLTRLVDDLLDVSRITRGKIELDRRPIEVWDAVARAMEVASPLLEQRRHLVDVDVPSSGLVVDADIHRLAQVVSNLLTNAAKYSDPESRIMIRAERVDKTVKLTVKDEGIGIPPEMLGRVFDAFVQQPQAIDRSSGGLGLGLAIVRSLVTMHGGTVRAESLGAGRGSAFVVELPIAPSRRSEAAIPVKAAVRGASNRRRVLVVDDNEDAAEMLAGALVQIGYDVVVAHDAPSALERSREFDPDVALLDIGLPVVDGYELAERLRLQAEGRRTLSLIAVTGYGQEADRVRSDRAGFERHLVKPIDLQQLAVTLEATLIAERP